MVITCPNCEAKYKLPGEKLKGRGAKITCPRCAHVFVIFNQEAEAAPPAPEFEVEAPPADDGMDEPSGARRTAPPGPPPSPPREPRSGPLPRGLKAEDIFTSDYGGVDFDVAQSRGSAPKAPPRAPPEAPPKATSVEPPSVSERPRPSVVGQLAAETLDFKCVGVATWKVKVAIGLIYDFADIKTLRKSIRENKVTHDDQISHDGKEWTRIGSDAELEVYFAGIHARLMDETGGKIVEEKPRPKAPVATATTSTTREPLGAAADDAFRVDLRQRPGRASQRRKSRKTEERKLLGMNPTWVGIGVAAIVVIGLIITLGNSRGLFGNDDEDQPTSRITNDQLEDLAEKARERIDKDLAAGTDKILDEQPSEGTPDDYTDPGEPGRAVRRNPDGSFDDTGLEPIIPNLAESSTPTPPVEREDPTPREEPTEAPTAAVVAESTADSTVEETTADDWFMLGDMALGSGNCGNAIPHLQKAVSMQGGNSNFNYKLGMALHQCGRSGEAVGPLKAAAGSIGAAQDLLDQIEGGGSE